MESDDVFANEVVIDGPMFLELVVVGAVANSSDVVGQRIEPDVGDVFVIPRQGNAPRKTGSANTEVEQTLFDEANDFVHPIIRDYCLGMGRIPLEQTIAVPGEAEKVVLFFDCLDRLFVNRAISIGEIILDVVRLASHTVKAAVGVEFDIAVVVARLKEFLHSQAMTGFSGADEIVVADVQPGPGFGKKGRNRIGKFQRIHAGGIGGLLNFQAVLISSGEEVNPIAKQAVPANQGITHNCGVGMTEMGFGVDVIYGCRGVKRMGGR